MYDEFECFDISKATEDDLQKIADICEWFVDRIGEIDGGRIESMWFNSDGFNLETSYEDYCRGCHMGTINETHKIPKDIIFSGQSIPEWQREQGKIRKQKEEEAKKKKAANAEKARKRKATLDAIRKEKEERAEYVRLKEKYEG